MKFSIAISSFNRLEYLKNCINSLMISLEPCSDFEILIVDSSTKKDVKDYLETLDKNITVIHKNYETCGEALTHNLKFEKSQGQYVFHCCDDYVIENQQKRDWLRDFEIVFNAEKTVSVVMNEKPRNSGWKYPNHRIFWDQLQKKKCGNLEYVILQNPYKVNYPVVGWMYKKEAFVEVGEFRGQGYKNNLPVDWYHTLAFQKRGFNFAVLLNSAFTIHIGEERCY